MYSNQYYPTSTDIMRQQNNAYIKEYLKKPRILVLAIFTTVSLLFTVLYSILSFRSIDSVSSLDTITNSTKYTSFSSTLGMFIQIGIGILFAAAIFMVYFKSKNADPASSPSGGIGILYVLTLINFIMTCIGSALLLVLVLITAFIPDISTYENRGVLPFMLFILILVLFIWFFWSFSVFRFISSIKKGLNTSAPLTAKGATATGVFYILSAVLSALAIPLIIMIPTGLGALSSQVPSYTAELTILSKMMTAIIPIFLLLSVINVATNILYAVIALGYKKHISAYNQSNYTSNFASGYVVSPYAPKQNPYVASPYNYVGNPTPSPAENQDTPAGENPPPSTAAPVYPPENTDTTEQNHTDPIAENPAPAVCPYCGVPYDKESSFCETCGQRLN